MDEIEVLVVFQGFERGSEEISNFKMDDFRGEKLPNFDEPGSSRFRKYYRIERALANSRCPWGYSRWKAGEDGKLSFLDSYFDTSG